ncbi:MAG TPA: SpoIIE family protein phosphatase [Candidatus Binatia bacterium]|nr:SpoIIE family protein phosphatase [Candidatus Binatia bacterium]
MTLSQHSDDSKSASAASVLVVDDNHDKRFLLRRILDKTFTVLEADNGATALATIGEALPDVVLLDVLMPQIDGFEVCRRMKGDPRTAEIPVLFVSVLDPDQHVVEGLQLGGEDFISWPVNATELVARIQARIRSYRPLNQLRSVVKEQSRQLEEDRRREAETEFELEQAKRVQQRFVTTIFPQGRSLAFGHRYRPSRVVGGDMFDVVAVGEHEVAIMMADVSGHGLAAALLTSVAKVLFRIGAEQCREPAELLRWLNRQISSYLATGEFLTVFLGLWNAKSQLFSYAGAGHPPALLLTPANGSLDRLHVSPGIVGILRDGEFSSRSAQLSAGQRIVCYTDGITEAMNGRCILFGEDGLAAACARSAGVPIDQMVEKVFCELDQFVGSEPRRDDQAMLALEVTE